MRDSNSDLFHRIEHIEKVVQNHGEDTGKLKDVVDELKSIVQSLDKDMAIQTEKQTHLLFRIEQLYEELEELGKKGDKTNDNQRELIEKTLMAFLGGLITYIFSLTKK